MRLFTAVTPPTEVVEHLRLALPAVPYPALRLTDPSTWHVTLAFHGGVPAATVTKLAGRLAALTGDREPFALRLAGAGTFMGKNLWIGIGGAVDALRELTENARAAGRDIGLPDDPRVRARAHLTVARSGGRGAAVIAELVRALSVYRGPEWVVDEVSLFASHLGQGSGGGPVHEELAAVTLGR